MTQLKVKAKSSPKSVAGAIAGMFKDGAKELKIVTVGAGALNQAYKAVAIARGFLAPVGFNLIITPSFVDVEIDGVAKTAMCSTITSLADVPVE